jgi:exodeoxyribonuclease VII small subunit
MRRAPASRPIARNRLKAAQLRVEKIVVGPDGQAKGVEPAEFS